jgi:AcrR family transcriptional regulator
MSSSSPAPERLTLEAIVDAAADLVGREGFDGLSMRKLARRCNVGVMTLYGYVPTKDDLLGALADRLLADLEVPGGEAGDWQEQIRAVFRSVRRVFLEHPELTPIIAAGRVGGTAAYRGAETVFAALRACGLTDAQVLAAFGALTSFTVGSAQREIGVRTPARAALPGIEALSPEEFPHVIALAGPLATRDPEREFEAGLDLLITGIEASKRSRSARRKP